jgi:site-specific recombinase XerC
MRLSELAGIRYDPGDPRRSDLDLWHREITVHGKGRKTRTVKNGHDAARALDRYIPEGNLMELNGWTFPQMLRRYGASARSARARRSYDRIMDNTP